MSILRHYSSPSSLCSSILRLSISRVHSITQSNNHLYTINEDWKVKLPLENKSWTSTTLVSFSSWLVGLIWSFKIATCNQPNSQFLKPSNLSAKDCIYRRRDGYEQRGHWMLGTAIRLFDKKAITFCTEFWLMNVLKCRKLNSKDNNLIIKWCPNCFIDRELYTFQLRSYVTLDVLSP